MSSAVNGDSSSPTPADSAPSGGVPEDSAPSSACTGTSGEEALGPEAPAALEHSDILSDSTALGAGAGGDLDPVASTSGSSPAFEAAKSRQPGGSMEPGRNTSTESLPSGYVPFQCVVVIDVD